MYEPELGQMAFGNPWRSYSLDDEYVTSRLWILSERINAKLHENNSMPAYGADYKNDVFSMFPYYWGGCDCGYDRRENDWYENHSHSDDCFHTRYLARENELKDLNFKKLHREMIQWSAANGYPFAPDGMAVHCTCDYEDEWEKFISENNHSTDCLSVRPNFQYEDIVISWYKYIGRGMSCNKELDRDEWREIFDRCDRSV